MEKVKICKFYDMWCKGERSCKGCAHYKELEQYAKEQEKDDRDDK